MHFGMLRVLNDDIIAGGMGFGMHPHSDMEIITIILEGALEHRDDMGNGSVIRPGDVQVMSAGTGVFHSEFNPDENQPAKLFQLWIFPKEKNITPRYDQKSFEVSKRLNGFQTIASGFGKGEELYIHQDAALSLSTIEAGKSITYHLSQKGNGAYIMVINGEVQIQGVKVATRDAIGIWESDQITVEGSTDAELLIVDVPMH
jgi:redox-sensitive bicupin YhaK (pirin superfamily)